jgi:SAM-dependent methyltransferase
MGAPLDASQLYTEHADAYLRFVRLMGYPRGLRSVFMRSPALRPGLRILDAGCGTGTTTLALRSAAEARGIPISAIDAFDLTPAMLERFRTALDRAGIEGVRLEEADVLRLDTLPETWNDYDLVVTASMLEYVPRSSLATALRGLHERLRTGGTLLLFITRNNFLMRPLIGRGWSAHLYTRTELGVALEEAGFDEAYFGHFPFPYRHLDAWGHVVTAHASSARITTSQPPSSQPTRTDYSNPSEMCSVVESKPLRPHRA